jgi:hypothetical protein
MARVRTFASANEFRDDASLDDVTCLVLDVHSLRKGGGLVDATGGWLVGAKGDSPLLRRLPCLAGR